MHISRVFFKISDLANHSLRNYKRYPAVVREKNIVFDDRFGNKTMMDVYYPKSYDNKLPVLVNVHGGGFVCGDKRYRSGIARFFASHGWFVVNTNYRLAPKFSFPAPVEDTINAVIFINTLEEKYRLDLDKIVMTGDSAGGYYAAHALACTVNEKLRNSLGLPAYTGRKIRALLTFCAPFNLMKCFLRKVPFNITLDVINSVFSTNYKDYNVREEFKYTETSNILNYVNGDFPETFIVAAERDSFCGGQIGAMLEKLKENGVKHGSYIANMKGDGHCTHLLPFKKGTAPALKAATDFLENIIRG